MILCDCKEGNLRAINTKFSMFSNFMYLELIEKNVHAGSWGAPAPSAPQCNTARSIRFLWSPRSVGKHHKIRHSVAKSLAATSVSSAVLSKLPTSSVSCKIFRRQHRWLTVYEKRSISDFITESVSLDILTHPALFCY